MPSISLPVNRFIRFLILLGALILAAFFIDKPVAHTFHDLRGFYEWTIPFWRFYTYLGDGAFWVVVPMFVYAFAFLGTRLPSLETKRLQRWALFTLLGVGLAGLTANFLKRIIGRARPGVWLADNTTGDLPLLFSPLTFKHAWMAFPSGHSATAMAAAYAFTKLWPKGRWFWITIAGFVMMSRVILEAHFVSDVLAGGILGWIVMQWFDDRLVHSQLLRRCASTVMVITVSSAIIFTSAPPVSAKSEGSAPKNETSDSADKPKTKEKSEGKNEQVSGNTLPLKPLFVSVVENDGKGDIIAFFMVLRVDNPTRLLEMQDHTAQIRDVLVTTLYTSLNGENNLRKGRVLNLPEIKKVALDALIKTFGAESVQDVFIQNVTQRSF